MTLKSRLVFWFLLFPILAWGQSNSKLAFKKTNSAEMDLLKGSKQILLVLTENWDSVGAVMQKFERKQASSEWTPVGKPFKSVVGKKGMGWGRGLHPFGSLTGPIKQEGDGKAPAGVFKISKAFGYDLRPKKDLSEFYAEMTPQIECVDDVKSEYYNKIVDKTQVKKIDWDSSEEMVRKDELYRYGLVVEHNTDNPIPGGGSCIFMHVWRGPTQGTAGCTAVEMIDSDELLDWINADAEPLLVQMPKAEYHRYKKLWGLP